jgi:predicted TIM-barrel fold metal-dependent hydrolase
LSIWEDVVESWDTIDRYVVISSDCHAGADLRDYRPYLASRWHDDFDVWADSYKSPFDDLIHATAHRNWDSDFRLSELDADGIAGEVVIPNTIPPFFPTTALIVVGLPKTKEDFERRWAGVQAHNRWVVDFVSLAPKRRRGLVQIFPNDVEVAMEEIRWAHGTGAFGGALLVPVPPGHPVPPFFHTCYDPMWALLEELDMPFAMHNTSPPDMPLDQPASNAVMMLEGVLWSQATLIDMILAGVFERFPNIKFVPTEADVTWPMTTALGLDHSVRSMKSSANRTMGMFSGSSINDLSMLPSEYVQRNVYYGASGAVVSPAGLQFVRDQVGPNRFMWGCDYPHEEGTTPQSREALRWLFEGIPEAEVRQMLAGTIAGVYGFDLEALTPIAQEIGPLVSDISTPLRADEYVEGEYFGAAPFPGGALLMRSRAADTHF